MAAADIIEWFADEGLRVYGRIVPSRGNLAMRQMVLKDPVGPVAAFTPWNFPVNQVVRKLAAALDPIAAVAAANRPSSSVLRTLSLIIIGLYSLTPYSVVGRIRSDSGGRITSIPCAANVAESTSLRSTVCPVDSRVSQ